MVAKPRINIRITDDGMAAIASIQPGEPAGAAEVDAALAGAGVSFGVDAAACHLLSAALNDPQFCDQHVELAFGQQAQQGSHGFFEPAFHVGIQAGTLRDDGSMDFYDRELLKPVAEGALVGRLYAAVSGIQGQRVDGGLLHVDAVREVRLRLGPGVEADAEGRVHAKQAGIVAYTPEKLLDVVDHLVHKGDVDLRSGHLVMDGTLAVQGDVQRLFGVRVTGDVEIRGSVQGGSVYAGGDARIKNRVFGGDTGMVCAEGSLWARHAESARITCGGVLQLESATNCQLCAEDIKVTRGLRGGSTAAECSVVAQEAGSPHGGLSTVLSAAVPLERPVIEAQRALGAAKTMPLADRRGAAAGRSEAHCSKGGKLARTNAGLQRRELEQKVQRAERRELLLASAYVQVTGVCHAGVVVEIGEVRLVLDQDQRGVRFSFDRETRELRMERPSK
jgi:hypothetical protein